MQSIVEMKSTRTAFLPEFSIDTMVISGAVGRVSKQTAGLGTGEWTRR